MSNFFIWLIRKQRSERTRFFRASRNGTIRIYRIIKWLDLIEKWDFYQVFIWKKAHIFVYLAKIGGVKFPEKVNKNATTHNNFFLDYLNEFSEVYINFNNKFEILVKNETV